MELQDQDQFSPRAVYQHWRLRQDQWQFLYEGAVEQRSPTWAVEQWDQQHRYPFSFHVLSLSCHLSSRVCALFLGRVEGEKLGPVVFTWSPSAQEVFFYSLVAHLLWYGVLSRLFPWRQRVLLWMLPVEMWREVLGFCPFNEYVRLMGLRRAVAGGRPSLQWLSRPVSCEFYFLLKLALLEMRFHTMLPSASLGGLWLASRGQEARFIRKLRLGGWCACVFILSCLVLWRPHGAGCSLSVTP